MISDAERNLIHVLACQDAIRQAADDRDKAIMRAFEDYPSARQIELGLARLAEDCGWPKDATLTRQGLLNVRKRMQKGLKRWQRDTG